jgi:hypothetical protein
MTIDDTGGRRGNLMTRLLLVKSVRVADVSFFFFPFSFLVFYSMFYLRVFFETSSQFYQLSYSDIGK